MTVVLALVGMEAEAVGAEVGRRLRGPTVVIPYDSMLIEWPITPPEDWETLAALTGQQAKLLCAGYVKAGYHVMLVGNFSREPLEGPNDAQINSILRLMSMVPGVHSERADLDPILERAAAALRIVAQLPVEEVSGGN
jgi:hypothetical protein